MQGEQQQKKKKKKQRQHSTIEQSKAQKCSTVLHLLASVEMLEMSVPKTQRTAWHKD